MYNLKGGDTMIINEYALQTAFDMTAEYFGTILQKRKQVRIQMSSAINEMEVSQALEEFYLWKELEAKARKNMKSVIDSIEKNNIKIIISKSEHIIALIYFMVKNNNIYKIINEEENNLSRFPLDELGKAFYKAYCLEDKKTIKELYNQYI